jgi:AcrR family transcriptional regulator
VIVARRPTLTRQAITDAALAAAGRGELETLTMRGLAQELGVTAMALYTHVTNKDDILDAVLDAVLARDAEPPPVDVPDWREWTLVAASRLQAVLVAFPPLLDRYRRRPVGVPAALRRMEAALEVYRRAGFGDDECVAAYAIVHTYTIGFAALEIGRQVDDDGYADRTSGVLTDASPHFWPAFLAGLDPDAFPNLVRLTPDLAGFTDEEQFARGLLAIIAGLEARRATQGGFRPPTPLR